MSYNIALNFEDGVTRFIGCRDPESVVDAAYRQGINIPMDCREGACSTCKCRVESGSYSLGEYIEDALSKVEADTGYALGLPDAPQDRLRRADPDRLGGVQPQAADLRRPHQGRAPLSESTFSLVLEGEALKKLMFLPGQYANLQVPGSEEHQRAYSFSSMAAGSSSRFLPDPQCPRRADERLPQRARQARHRDQADRPVRQLLPARRCSARC